MKKQLAVCLMALMMLFGPMLVEAQAVGMQNATVALSYTINESLTLTATGGPAVFDTVTKTTAPITVSIAWVLAGTRTSADAQWGFSSASAALVNGTSNIPSNQVFDNDGGSYAAIADLMPTGTEFQTGSGIATGAFTHHGIHVAISAANLNGNASHTFNLQLQGLSASLAAGTYTGTLQVCANVI